MVYRDPKSHSRAVKAFAKASTGTGANNGTGFKKTGFDYALWILDLGVLGTAATVDVKIQHSDTLADGVTWVDITGAAFAQKVKASHDNVWAVAQTKLSGLKKYLRPVVTVGAAASVVGVHCVLLGPDRSEEVSIAQGGSEAVAAPTAASGSGAYEFAV